MTGSSSISSGGGCNEMMPLTLMVLLQLGYAGMNIISKLAMDSGFNPYVLVAYRQIFATVATFPLAIFLERKPRPRITLPILFKIFQCSITGALMNQVFYFVGLHMSTPTIACALSNILPAMTFVFALFFRQEKLGLRTAAGQAKMAGTAVCVTGAMLISFYHGPEIGIGNSAIHWKYAENMENHTNSSAGKQSFMGPIFLLASTCAWALWFVLQAKLSITFPAPYTTTTLMSLMASFECVIVALCKEHHVSAWSLSSGVRLIASVYVGVVCSAMAFCVMSWCIEKKGALYVSVFTPLMLILTAVLSWALLREKMDLGICLGSVLIIVGLYAVLWGKNKEDKQIDANTIKVEEDGELENKMDMELQPNQRSNGGFR
ncbi:hypothetical protein SAY86_029422 [Trapa natans]|uniref:WAT1-related protein n=1 Tax=Trapa natans TaxID=22666 RepID=A0AAN7M168_TRANT|nr:hypothetical protein SAY86_029422 [Trapa natans]